MTAEWTVGSPDGERAPIIADSNYLLDLLTRGAGAAQAFATGARWALRTRLAVQGRIDRRAADAAQHVLHGLAWYATYAETLAQLAGWARGLRATDAFREPDRALAALLAGEYAAQLRAGIAMNQAETIRPWELTDDPVVRLHLEDPALRELAEEGTRQSVKSCVVEAVLAARGRATIENTGLDESLDLVRDQFRAFSDERVAPYAQGWHCADELIPLSIVEELGAIGVYGLTIPEEYGGHGMGKTAMCVVSEELSRGWLGVGSLATRAEIACELLLAGGTPEQKASWLPRIASAEVLPTAVFTEPNAGSDLGSLRTRAVLDDGTYRVSGAKTWITHGARADLMLVLARTDGATQDYRGLSILLAPKPRGTPEQPFPGRGMSGSEIRVIGYRGMKEYEIGFDDFPVPRANLLGATEGEGFRQLMATFESARIQTAARAIGVAQAALDCAVDYASTRRQFGEPLITFPRVANKVAMIAAELVGVRQLTYYAARMKDAGKRCDLEAGMAKLIGARIAWSAADSAVQVHGGNGFAEEYVASRLLADARILNIFEGAGEIQAQVIARRLMDGTN